MNGRAATLIDAPAKRVPSVARASLVLASLALITSIATSVGAQNAHTGRLEGVVSSSAQSRPARDASIVLARVEPEPSVSFGARPDDRGHYQIDSLPVGRYMIQLTHAKLDSLELALPTDEVNIVAGETSRAHFSLPSSIALRNAVCRGLTLTRGTGAVFGRVVDADSEEPITDADVAISWMELGVDRVTLRSTAEEHTGWVRTGARGEYRICNVPTGSWLLVQLQHAGRAGNAVRLAVSEEEGVIVRNLSLSMREAPTLAALDSVGGTAPPIEAIVASDSIPTLHLTGSASVSGVVRAAGGRPVGDVQIRVVNASPTTRTDDQGRYTLNGLPAGTQLLIVRRIGYLVGDVAVELRPGKSIRQDVNLKRVVSLDSMRVVAERARYAEFEENRKHNMFGRFLTADQVAQRHALQTGQLLETIPGFGVRGAGPDAVVFSNSAHTSRVRCAEANVVIDGSDHAHINDVTPQEIAGIEAYPEAAGAPAQYRAECGLIVVWTKLAPPKPRS